MGNKQGRPAVNVDPELLKPSGLYPSASYDERALRRLILERKVAPCFRGSEEPGSTHGGGGGEECPICMLFYPALNTSSCCKKRICTECYLQMAPPTSNKTHNCPFCKRGGYAVEYRGPLSALEQQSMQGEEQRVIELQIEQQVREAASEVAAVGSQANVHEGSHCARSAVLRGALHAAEADVAELRRRSAHA